MRFFAIAAVLALGVFPAHAQAPATRAALSLANNSIFTNCGTGCITGRGVNQWNAATINSFGVLSDSNIWTGVNTFVGSTILATSISGAKFDGITDDGPAINAAIANQAAQGGGVVYLPPGRARIATPVIERTGVSLIGASGVGTSLLCNVGANACLTNDPANQLAGIRVSDFALYPFSPADTKGTAVWFTNLAHSTIQRLRIENFYDMTAQSGTAIRLGGILPTNFVDTDLSLGFVAFDDIRDNTIAGCYDCILASGYIPPGFPVINGTKEQGVTQVLFANNNIWYAFHKGLIFRDVANAIVVVGGVVELTSQPDGPAQLSAYVESDDPAFSQTPSVATGGTGFTANAVGFATYTGANCTTNPVVNLATDGSGNLIAWSMATPGACSSFPTASSAWVYTGVGAGTATLTVADVGNAAVTGINTYSGVTVTANAGTTGQCAVNGGFTFGSTMSGFITDQDYRSGNAGNNAFDCRKSADEVSFSADGNQVDPSAQFLFLSTYHKNVAYGGNVNPQPLYAGVNNVYPGGYSGIAVTNSSNVAAPTIQLPCTPNDGTNLTFSALSPGVRVSSITWTTGTCGVMTAYSGLPASFSYGNPITIHYLTASNTWIPWSGLDPNNVALTGGAAAGLTLTNATVASSTTAGANLHMLPGSAPTSPANGDVWTTTTGLWVQSAYGPTAVTGVPTGAVPVNSGSCSINTQLGGSVANNGNIAGSFKANGACVAGTVILTFLTTAANDWACSALDATTPADTVLQSNTTASTTSATFKATMVSGDLVRYKCEAF